MTGAAKKAPTKVTPVKKAAVTLKAGSVRKSPDKLSRTGLVDYLTAQTTFTRTQTASAVDAVLDDVIEALKAGKTVGSNGWLDQH